MSAEPASVRPPDIHAHRVLILDFGSQYTQLIARRVRELGVYCEIHPWDTGDEAVRAFGARGIILSGGPESVTQAGAPARAAAVFELGVPVLGICYGMQTMAAQLGGRVEPGAVHEFGYAEVRARGHSALLRDIEDRVDAEGHGVLDVWMSHGDRVVALPPGFKAIASTPDLPIAGMADEARRLYALQFHPEVTHTRQGARIYERFLHEHLRLRRRLERRQHHRGCGRTRARSRSAAARCCSDCRAASTPRWSRRCCTRRSATS